MVESYTYSRATLGGISDSLNALFSGMEKDGTQVMRTTNCNLILLVSSKKQLQEIERVVEPLTLFHPSRFFLIVLDDTAPELHAEIAALCHGISKSENQCAEVIRIITPRSQLASVPGVLRAHSLPGVATELFLGDAHIDREVIDLFIPLCEQVYLDSGDFQRRGDVLHFLRQHPSSLVDFQWVHLGAWRDQIAAAFNHSALSGQASHIRSIEISGVQSATCADQAPFAVFLMAGWFLDRLGLALQGVSSGVVRTRSRSGADVEIKIQKAASAGSESAGRIVKIVLSGFDANGKILSASFERKGAILETSIQRERTLRFSRPIDDEGIGGIIKRYFLVGESITNYPAALRGALEVQRLLGQ